jgi:hypothetical protein
MLPSAQNIEIWKQISVNVDEIQSSEAETYQIFKNLTRTAKKTPHFTITKINRLTLIKEIIADFSENHT